MNHFKLLWFSCLFVLSSSVSKAQFNLTQHLLSTQKGSAGEALAYGVPPTWDWAQAATFGDVSAAPPNSYANYWGGIFRGQTNATPINTEVQISNTTMWVLYNGATEWIKFQDQSSNLGGTNYTPSYGTGTQWNELIRHTPEGSFVIPATENIWHFWSGTSFKFIENNIREILVNTQVRLVLKNPYETDDRSQADYLVHIGADKRDATGSCPNGICTSYGISKFMKVTNEWRNITMHSITQADIDNGVILPPLNIFDLPLPVPVTGVSATPTTTSISVGTASKIIPTVTPANATNKNVNYSSSNPAVATVDVKGTVIGVSVGSVTITVTTEEGSKVASAIISVTASDLAADVARYKNTTASSVYNYNYFGSLAVDGSSATNWSSKFEDPQWIYVDLGASYSISRVKLVWESAFGKSYKIQVSNDATSWTDIFSTTTGDGGTDDLNGLSGSGRYVRVYGTARGTIYGYALFDLQVYRIAGSPPTNTCTNVAKNKPTTVSSTFNNTVPSSAAVDGDLNTRWSSAFSDPQWIYVDLGTISTIRGVKLTWEDAYGKSYKIQVSNNKRSWTDIYSTTTGDGGIDEITGLNASGRYVRMYGTARGTVYGYSLYEFEICTSVSAARGDLSLFPNPVISNLNIITNSGDSMDIQIFDLSGRLLQHAHLEQNGSMDLSHLKTGLYLIKINDGQTVKTQKFLKK